MGKLTGRGLAGYAITLLGTPYFYGAKIQYGKLTESFMEQMHHSYPRIVTQSYMKKARVQKQVGVVNVDCSGIPAAYRKKMLGSAQLYATAKKRLPIKDIKDFAIGTVLWKEGHVGVYIGCMNGAPMCIEAKGINYGTVETRVASTDWKYGLTFDDIEYDYKVKVKGTSKGKNPYKEPTGLVRYGATGTGVRWLQWELVESGYDINIDGMFGDKTLTALKKFQKSSKIKVDGICGPDTKNKLIAA